MSVADNIIAYGLAEVGKPYHYGDEGPNAFDCSGLMQYIFGKAGISLPRTSEAQQAFATPVTNPVPGDLVFFGRPAYHVGLYLGNGRMLAAPHTGANVRVQDVGDATSYGRIPGAGTGAVAQTVSSVTTVGASLFDWNGLLDKLADSGRILLFTAGGGVLVIVGMWVTVKGKNNDAAG